MKKEQEKMVKKGLRVGARPWGEGRFLSYISNEATEKNIYI